MDAETRVTVSQYCVYHHVWDGIIFYVGSGIMSRPFVRTDRNKRWLEFVRNHPNYEVRIVSQHEILSEARSEEARQIKEYRPICNGKDKSVLKRSGTSVISIRVSNEWLAYVDAEAERCRWKRNAAVVNLTWDGLEVRGALGEHPSDSIEPQPANGNVGLNAVMHKDNRQCAINPLLQNLPMIAVDKEKRDGIIAGRVRNDVAPGFSDREGQRAADDGSGGVRVHKAPRGESSPNGKTSVSDGSRPCPSCPRCGESKGVVPWGSGNRCQECKVNF